MRANGGEGARPYSQDSRTGGGRRGARHAGKDGIANLKGRSVAERAHALIAIAHPDCREGLERQAYENRLIPRGLML